MTNETDPVRSLRADLIETQALPEAIIARLSESALVEVGQAAQAAGETEDATHCICAPDDDPNDHRPDCPQWRIQTRSDDDVRPEAADMSTADGLGGEDRSDRFLYVVKTLSAGAALQKLRWTWDGELVETNHLATFTYRYEAEAAMDTLNAELKRQGKLGGYVDHGAGAREVR